MSLTFLAESTGPTANPSLDEVHAHIRGITQCIQELLQAAQSQRRDRFAPCSTKILSAVDTMTHSFPPVSLLKEYIYIIQWLIIRQVTRGKAKSGDL